MYQARVIEHNDEDNVIRLEVEHTIRVEGPAVSEALRALVREADQPVVRVHAERESCNWCGGAAHLMSNTGVYWCADDWADHLGATPVEDDDENNLHHYLD